MAIRFSSSLIAAFIATSGVLGACSTDSDSASASEATSSQDQEVHWQAVALAESSVVASAPGGNVLRLNDVDPVLTAFSDRPSRLVGDLRVAEFLDLWRAGAFAGDPPNATMVADGAVTGVELLGAVWDPESRSLWFSIRPLDRVEVDDTAAATEPPAVAEGIAGTTQLFIDAFAAPVDAQVTDAVTQTNVKVLGDAPAQGMGLVYQSMADSIAMSGASAGNSEGLYALDASNNDAAIHKILGMDSSG